MKLYMVIVVSLFHSWQFWPGPGPQPTKNNTIYNNDGNNNGAYSIMIMNIGNYMILQLRDITHI